MSDDAYARDMGPGPSPDDAERDPDLVELEHLEHDIAALEEELETADSTPDPPVNPTVNPTADEPSPG